MEILWMVVFFGWVISAYILGNRAKKEGRSWAIFFILGIITTPLIGNLILFIVGSNKTTKCLWCSKNIEPNSNVCPFCGKGTISKYENKYIEEPNAKWKCPYCYNENPNTTYQCKNCGYNLV